MCSPLLLYIFSFLSLFKYAIASFSSIQIHVWLLFFENPVQIRADFFFFKSFTYSRTCIVWIQPIIGSILFFFSLQFFLLPLILCRILNHQLHKMGRRRRWIRRKPWNASIFIFYKDSIWSILTAFCWNLDVWNRSRAHPLWYPMTIL